MKFTELGKTGLTVSQIGFGTSRIGGFFAGKDSTAEALKTLGQALDSGITFYDTADMYSQGESESLIGAAFHHRRKDIVLATKGGYTLPAQRNLLKPLKPLVRPILRRLGVRRATLPAAFSGALSQDFTPRYLANALERSLRRLRTDFVDLYQLHSPTPAFMQTAAFGEALETLEKLKRQGKLRFFGIATEEPEDARDCLSAPGISSIQLGFSVLHPDALSDGILATAQARGLGIIARGCFGAGLLKDGLDVATLKAATPQWQRILNLHPLSKSMDRSLLDAAFQFCRGTSAVSVTLLGMRTEYHLREALRFMQASPLTAAQYAAFCHAGAVAEAPAVGAQH